MADDPPDAQTLQARQRMWGIDSAAQASQFGLEFHHAAMLAVGSFTLLLGPLTLLLGAP
jgi:hypothetical protein